MYEYKAKLIRVVDGDTLDAMIDLGFDIWTKKRIRLGGINAWESRTRDKEEKAKGLLAKAWVIDILKMYDNKFTLKSTGVGKYGRCIGTIYLSENYSLNEALLKEGHAIPL